MMCKARSALVMMRRIVKIRKRRIAVSVEWFRKNKKENIAKNPSESG